MLVCQLDSRSVYIVIIWASISVAVLDAHIVHAFVVTCVHHQGECLADLNDGVNVGCQWPTSLLQVHPALDRLASLEADLLSIQHPDSKGIERHGLNEIVNPVTLDRAGDVPYFLHRGIVLYDDGVGHAGTGLTALPAWAVVGDIRGSCAALTARDGQ